jgi:hypothetical protein
MVGTAKLRSLGMPKSKECDPDKVTLLTRDVLARPGDPRRNQLHKKNGSPGVRVAAGRWQVVAFDARYPVTITSWDDLGRDPRLAFVEAARTGKPLSLDVLDAITVKQVDKATPGREFDAYDGSWILLVRQWAAMLTVRGQPRLTEEQSGPHADLTDQGYPFPKPTEKGHLDAVRAYLGQTPGGRDVERAELRRLALAYRYRWEVRWSWTGKDESDEHVTKLFKIGIQNVKTELRKKIWGRSGSNDRDSALLRYLLTYQVIGHKDVIDAERWVAEHPGRR